MLTTGVLFSRITSTLSRPNKRPSNRRVDALRNEAAGKMPVHSTRVSKVSRRTPPVRERQKAATAARLTNMQEEELSKVMASLKLTGCLDRTLTGSTVIETPPAFEIPMTIDTLVASDVQTPVQDSESTVEKDTPMSEAADVPLLASEAEETEWLNEMEEGADLFAGWT